jgi:nucleotide-binding universal stress UspA family protein
MSKEISLLFGIDASDFARQALIQVGGLLKNSKNLRMALFHGAFEPDFSFYSESIDQGLKLEKLRERWDLESRQVLQQAHKALTASGFDPDKLSTIFEEKCGDPAYAMLKLARHEGIDSLAVARWGKKSVSRQVIGSVTYKLSQSAEDKALWVIDPRICSPNVLVGIVGAPVSQRVVDHVVRYFSHLKESKFTLMHVSPAIPPQYWESEGIPASGRDKYIAPWLQEYTERVKAIAGDAQKKLIENGIPEQNVVIKLEPQKRGIARDILVELEEGNHGILVIGRKGYKNIKEFGLGSKAHKLLISGRAFIICLVN